MINVFLNIGLDVVKLLAGIKERNGPQRTNTI